MDILKLENVVKTYGNNTAVDHVSFSVPRAGIFGLLGPNGAGKTSIIRIITTITRADAGTVYLDGEPLGSRHPAQIGYMPEERGLYKKMKVGEHLLYLAQLKGLSHGEAKREIDHWLEKFSIADWWNKKVDELSKGMQQKMQFISTVVHRPRLLILDEPFSGLDPINTNLIKDEIYQLHEGGTSIIFSTHRMEQVEEICEKIVLINSGKNVLEGSVADIKDRNKQNRFRVAFSGELPPGTLPADKIIAQKPGLITVQLEKGQDANQLLRTLLAKDVHITGFNEILPSLNEIFIKVSTSAGLDPRLTEETVEVEN